MDGPSWKACYCNDRAWHQEHSIIGHQVKGLQKASRRMEVILKHPVVLKGEKGCVHWPFTCLKRCIKIRCLEERKNELLCKPHRLNSGFNYWIKGCCPDQGVVMSPWTKGCWVAYIIVDHICLRSTAKNLQATISAMYTFWMTNKQN